MGTYRQLRHAAPFLNVGELWELDAKSDMIKGNNMEHGRTPFTFIIQDL